MRTHTSWINLCELCSGSVHRRMKWICWNGGEVKGGDVWQWPPSGSGPPSPPHPFLHRLTEDLSNWLPSRYPTYPSPSPHCYAQHKQLGGSVLDPELIATLAAYNIRHPGVLNWLRPFVPQEQGTYFLPVLMKMWGGCSSCLWICSTVWMRQSASDNKAFMLPSSM